MIRKYIKKHDIQHFKVKAIVSLKILKEDKTFTNNKQLFTRILKEPYSHKYKVLTLFSIISCLILTKGLKVIN
jgi:hypothetical protein